MPHLHDDAPRLGHFGASQGAGTIKFGDGTQRCEVFDGLVIGPSSPTPMESCVKMWMVGISMIAERRIEGASSQRDEEAEPKADLREGEAVKNRRHGVLADAEWKLRPE